MSLFNLQEEMLSMIQILITTVRENLVQEKVEDFPYLNQEWKWLTSYTVKWSSLTFTKF